MSRIKSPFITLKFTLNVSPLFSQPGENYKMAEDSQEEKAEFTARPYQLEIFEKARKENVIVCLGTGTGKTFISVMLIKDLAHQINGNLKEGGKRTFFLVTTGTGFFYTKLGSGHSTKSFLISHGILSILVLKVS